MENILAENGKKRRNKAAVQENLWGWLFVLLPIFGTCFFVFYPLCMTIFASFTSWSGMVPLSSATAASGNAFSNYVKVFTDEHFWATLGNTFFYMIGIPIGMILSLLLALCMNRKIHFSSGFRVIYYIPVVASVVSITLLFSRMFDYEGIINKLLGAFGAKPVQWMNGPSWLKKLTIVLMMTWKGLGGTILLFIAGLQGVNKTYYEAATLDGAGPGRLFFKITLPQLYPVVFYVLVTSIIGGAQIYTEPALFYPNGGDDVNPLVQYLWTQFTQSKAGYSSAIGMVLFLLVFVVTAVQFAVNNRREKAA